MHTERLLPFGATCLRSPTWFLANTKKGGRQHHQPPTKAHTHRSSNWIPPGSFAWSLLPPTNYYVFASSPCSASSWQGPPRPWPCLHKGHNPGRAFPLPNLGVLLPLSFYCHSSRSRCRSCLYHAAAGLLQRLTLLSHLSQVGGPSRGTRFRPLSLDLPKVSSYSSHLLLSKHVKISAEKALMSDMFHKSPMTAPLRCRRPSHHLALLGRHQQGVLHSRGVHDWLL